MESRNKLENIVFYAKENIPFYYGQTNRIFEEIPIIKKFDIRNNYNDFICDKIANKKKLVEYLENKVCKTNGWYTEDRYSDDIIIEETSGTSGTPFLCIKSIEERSTLGINLWKERMKIDKKLVLNKYEQFSHVGLGKKNPRAYCYDPKHVFELYNQINKSEIRWVHSAVKPLLNHIKILKEYYPDLKYPNLKYIEVTGSFLSKENKNIIENFYNVKVINQYGCIETWPIGISIQDNMFDILKGNVYVELIDTNGNVILEPEIEGEVVVTSLVNRFMPFIRYSIGDYGKYVMDEGKKYLQLINERDCFLLYGTSKKIYGNIIFREALKSVKLQQKILGLKYVKFIQIARDTVVVNCNYFSGAIIFFQKVFGFINQKWNLCFDFKINYLSEKEIELTRYEKEYLFVNHVDKKER